MGEFHLRVIEVRIALGHGDGGLIKVHAGDVLGSCKGGGDAEAAGVAAQVEHGPTGRQCAELFPAVPLVAEEAGLVSFAEVDLVAHPVLADFHRADVVRLRAAAVGDAFDPGQILIHADDHPLRPEAFVEQRQPLRQSLPGREIGDFHREHIGEFIHDDAGHEIRVAVDRAVAVGLRVQLQDLAPEVGGAADRRFKK